MTTTPSKDDEKREAARAALRYIDGARIVGVGTGSTVRSAAGSPRAFPGRLPGWCPTQRPPTDLPST